MKYFIDFEATQFSEEIISVGCIREDGETFYSLVSPVKGKITPFITNLTGITAEMLQNAMSPDTVFEQFYDWVFNNDITPDFYVWGNSDIDFLRHTFRRTNSQKARLAIGYMAGSIMDYSKTFCKIAKIEGCALIKAYNALIDENKVQNHNALDDAVLLFEVYKLIQTMETNEIREKMQPLIAARTQTAVVHTPKPKKAPVVKWSKMGFPVGTVCMIDKREAAIKHFDGVDEAAEWLLKYKISEAQKETVNLENVKRNIRRSYSGRQHYFGHAWRLVAK